MKLRSLLAPVSLLYRGGLAVDRLVRSRAKNPFPEPVISVGNLTMGGTGKTPVLILLARLALDQNIKPAILTRGYRGVGSASPEKVLSPSDTDLSGFSDEVKEMREDLPEVSIGAGKNRRRMGAQISKLGQADFFFLDDGFQHWPLRRDLDVAVVDATNPFGGGVFPVGDAREPRCALKRAGVILLTRTELLSPVEQGTLLSSLAPFSERADVFRIHSETWLEEPGDGTPLPLTGLRGRKVLAVSAIGNARAFEKTLHKSGADVVRKRFLDHHDYSQGEWDDIQSEAAETGRFVIMTRKDWMKIRDLKTAGNNPMILRVRYEMDDADRAALLSRLKRIWGGRDKP